MVYLYCPHCQFTKEVSDKYLGTKGKCPECNEMAEAVASLPQIIESNVINIDELDVSDSWKQKFQILRKIGADDKFIYSLMSSKEYKALTFKEKLKSNFNFLAFLFGPFYYFAKTMWLKGAVLFGVLVIIELILTFIEMAIGTTFSPGIHFLPGAILCAQLADYDYYRLIIHKEKIWKELSFLLNITTTDSSNITNDRTAKVILLSKKKLLLMLIGSVIFVYGGIDMLTLDNATIEAFRRFNNPLLIHGIALVSIILFGIGGVIASIKIFDNKPGVVFKSRGIINNTGSSNGLIPWEDISGIEVYEIKKPKQKILVIKLKNPDKYIEQWNGFNQKAIRINAKMYGSPIYISSMLLAINFDELLQVSNEYFSKYGDIS